MTDARVALVLNMDGSAEWSASGLENRASRKAEGSIPLLSAWKMWPMGATSPAKGVCPTGQRFDSSFFRWMGAGTRLGL